MNGFAFPEPAVIYLNDPLLLYRRADIPEYINEFYSVMRFAIMIFLVAYHGGDLAAALLRSAGIYQLVNDGHHFVFDKRSALKKHFAHGKYLTVREIFAIFVVQQISAARAVVYDLLSEAYAC